MNYYHLCFFPFTTMGICASVSFNHHEEMLNTATALSMLMRADTSLTDANKSVRVRLSLLISRHLRLHDARNGLKGQQDLAIG